MQKWHCPHCDEELLGAVNRCWKCGKHVVQPAPEPILVAEMAGGGEELVAADAGADLEPLTSDDIALALHKEPPRRGSPFALGMTVAPIPADDIYYGVGPYNTDTARTTPLPTPPLKARYPKHQAAAGSVAAGFILGAATLVILLFNSFGFVTAVLGVVVSIYGLRHDRKGIAVIALLLCCIGLALASYKIGFAIYDAWYSNGIGGGGLTF